MSSEGEAFRGLTSESEVSLASSGADWIAAAERKQGRREAGELLRGLSY